MAENAWGLNLAWRIKGDTGMRPFLCIAIAALSISLSACSNPKPPVGLWQGSYQGSDAMIVARLAIAPNGSVRVSAPNAFVDVADMAPSDREALNAELNARLAKAWPAVAPIAMTFDGSVFRKKGGVAPQLEWDRDAKRMTLIVYPGLHATIRVPLTRVRQFAASS